MNDDEDKPMTDKPKPTSYVVWTETFRDEPKGITAESPLHAVAKAYDDLMRKDSCSDLRFHNSGQWSSELSDETTFHVAERAYPAACWTFYVRSELAISASPEPEPLPEPEPYRDDVGPHIQYPTCAPPGSGTTRDDGSRGGAE